MRFLRRTTGPTTDPKTRYRFGPFLLDPARGLLERDGKPLALRPKPLSLLTILIENQGEILSKDRLLDLIWPGTAVSESALASTISTVRKALDGNADDSGYIETLPKRGYRFVGQVEVLGKSSDPSTVHGGARSKRPWVRFFLWMVPVLAFSVALAAWFESSSRNGSGNPAPSAEAATRPLVSTGLTRTPSISPDGKYVAFSWSLEKNHECYNIFIAPIDEGDPIQLTDNIFFEFEPTWSPDGRRLAFFRWTENKTSIVSISPLGGQERTLWETSSYVFKGYRAMHFDWSPDGEAIAFSNAANKPTGIDLLSLSTLQTRRLTQSSNCLDFAPAYSPDGRNVAFRRCGSVYVVSTDGGEPDRLFRGKGISGFDWSSDGEALIVSQASGVLRVPWKGGKSIQLSDDPAPLISVSPQGDRIAFEVSKSRCHIYRSNLPAEPRSHPGRRRMTWFESVEELPRLSPDGRKVAFISEHSSATEIWIHDGTQAAQRTFSRNYSSDPAWSPDGTQIAFQAWNFESRTYEIYRTNVDRGPAVRLTNPDLSAERPSWSRDGKWIYFSAGTNGTSEVWRIPAEGGNAVRLTSAGGIQAREGFDGEYLYFIKPYPEKGIFRLPLQGGPEELLVEEYSVGESRWDVTRDGVYFFRSEDEKGVTLNLFRFLTNQVEEYLELGFGGGRLGVGLSVSPDGQSIFYTYYDHNISEVRIAEGSW